jgi:hypothetical protein
VPIEEGANAEEGAQTKLEEAPPEKKAEPPPPPQSV